MRPLNRNEGLLAIALGALLFLFINIAGIRWVAGKMHGAHEEISRIETEAAAARLLLAERPKWIARQAWMEAHPPETYDDRNSRKFVVDVPTSVQAAGLKIDSQQPLETVRDGRLAVAKIHLVIRGRLESIVRWLHATQQPGRYALVETFTLNQADDGNSMQLDVLLGKVYRAAGPADSQ
ncbi:MAG: hypothetical protein PHC88_11315 [Terrimicrobiaceae bacterium]|nr:hypothetical protein [Terrimicrobiaceae bacterium]